MGQNESVKEGDHEQATSLSTTGLHALLAAEGEEGKEQRGGWRPGGGNGRPR